MQRLQSLKRKSARKRLRFIHQRCSGNKWVGISATIKYIFCLYTSAIPFARTEKLQGMECHHDETAQENDVNDDEFINECVKNENQVSVKVKAREK